MTRHWFLPETPDVLGTLNRQAAITIEGMEAFAAWAAGDRTQAGALRQAEHAADGQRRELAQQLRVSFTTPIDQEDLFTLSERLDAVLNMAKNVARDADLLAIPIGTTTDEMAQSALAGVRHLAEAFAALPKDPSVATDAADSATKCGRHMEKSYSHALGDIATNPDVRAAMLKHEHLQQCLKIGERIELVADRVWYSVVKEQ